MSIVRSVVAARGRLLALLGTLALLVASIGVFRPPAAAAAAVPGQQAGDTIISPVDYNAAWTQPGVLVNGRSLPPYCYSGGSGDTNPGDYVAPTASSGYQCQMDAYTTKLQVQSVAVSASSVTYTIMPDEAGMANESFTQLAPLPYNSLDARGTFAVVSQSDFYGYLWQPAITNAPASSGPTAISCQVGTPCTLTLSLPSAQDGAGAVNWFVLQYQSSDSSGIASNAERLYLPVPDQSPTAAMNISPVGDTSGDFAFDGSPSTAPAPATVTRYDWDFGDGSTATTTAPVTRVTHRFTTEGNKTVTLKVTASNGRTATTSETITPGLKIEGVTYSPDPVPAGSPFTATVLVQNTGTTTVTAVAPTFSFDQPTAGTVTSGPSPASQSVAPGLSGSFTFRGTAGATPPTSPTASVAATGTVGTQSLTAATVTSDFPITTPALKVELVNPPPVLSTTAPSTITVKVTALGRQGESGVTVADPVKDAGSGSGDLKVLSSDAAPFDLVAQGSTHTVTFQVEATADGPFTYTVGVSGTDLATSATVSASVQGTVAENRLVVTTTGDQADPSAALAANSCDVDPTTQGDQCTLRAAIQLANQRGGAATIVFDIPGGTTPTISPASALPTLAVPASVDGTSETGGWVRLSGASAGRVDGLTLAGDGSTVRGLQLVGWSGAALHLTGAGATVAGNRIGTADGTTASADGVGVLVDGGTATIGGTSGTSTSACSGDCNLIAGNSAGTSGSAFHSENTSGVGILVCGAGADTRIEGNWIGVAADGTTALPDDDGVMVDSGNSRCTSAGGASLPASVTVGGAVGRPGAAPGNLISGNWAGVTVLTGGSGTAIAGNLVGTDAGGTAAVSGSPYPFTLGVTTGLPEMVANAGHLNFSGTSFVARSSTAPTVGGATDAYRNVISGQTVTGLNLDVQDGTVPAAGPPPDAFWSFLDVGQPGATVDWDGPGVGVLGTAKVEHDYIGTDLSGTGIVSNELGVLGAGASATASVVSGNGIGLDGTFTAITGNLVGTNPTGTAAVPNRWGIDTGGTVGGVRGVGDTHCDGPCNLISGNTMQGVTANLLQGNFVGTDLAGTSALPNAAGVTPVSELQDGAFGAAHATTAGGVSGAVSGTCDQACNLVSGNRGYGLVADTIQGDVVGQTVAGQPLPNDGGVLDTGSSTEVVGGDLAGQGNVVADNTHGAVVLADHTGTVVGNRIHGNGAGIVYGNPDLTWQIVETPPGTNGVPALPRLVSSDATTGSGVTVDGLVPGVALGSASSYRIDLYAASDCATEPQGAVPLAHASYGLLSSGGFSLTAPALPAGDHAVTATITMAAPGGGGTTTSPFTTCLGVASGSVTPSTASPGDTVTATGDGFTPGEPVQASLHSTPIDLGTQTADANGAVRVTVTIPTDLAPGAHSIVLAGLTSQATVTIPITVVAATSAAPVSPTPVSPTPVSAAPTPASPVSAGGALAYTGSEVGLEVEAALGALLLGLVLVLTGSRDRRRWAHAATPGPWWDRRRTRGPAGRRAGPDA